MDTFSKLKHRFSNNQKLRHIKNSLQDDLDAIKHSIKHNKTQNKPSENKIAPILSESEKKEKYKEIIEQNSLQMDFNDFQGNNPLISIIVIGECSEELLKNFDENTGYNKYEIILDKLNKDLYTDFKENLNLVLNDGIDSEILNHTVKQANGEYILFLNGHIKTTKGWLNRMVETALNSDAAIVGNRIIFGNIKQINAETDYSCRIMSTGIGFKKGPDDLYEPYYLDEGLEPLINGNLSTELRAAVSINSMLVKKDKFLEVKGLADFPSPYREADLCLKIHEKGQNIVYNPNSILILEESPETGVKDSKFKDVKFHKIFKEKWDQYLNKNVLIDKVDGTEIFTKEPLRITFLVTEIGKDASAGDYFTSLEFGESLKKMGWEINYLARNGSDYWYNIDDKVDIIISLLDIYDPRRIKSSNRSLIKIGWPRNWFDRWVSHPGFTTYDIILTPSKTAGNYVQQHRNIKPFILPLATNSDKFNNHIIPEDDYICDYCFTGSYWKYTREIENMLDPDSLPYNFKLYGKNWDKSEKFKQYYQGFKNYSNLPKIYASTKLVIDDANTATKQYGSVNSRVFDALAAGAMVITNGAIGAEEIFNGELPVFNSKDELNGLINKYLKDEKERLLKVQKLQKMVKENHTYDNRAFSLKEIIKGYVL